MSPALDAKLLLHTVSDSHSPHSSRTFHLGCCSECRRPLPTSVLDKREYGQQDTDRLQKKLNPMDTTRTYLHSLQRGGSRAHSNLSPRWCWPSSEHTCSWHGRSLIEVGICKESTSSHGLQVVAYNTCWHSQSYDTFDCEGTWCGRHEYLPSIFG